VASLDELIKHITDINTLITAEEKMSALFKQLSKTVSEFETETSCLLGALHIHRDQQVTRNICTSVGKMVFVLLLKLCFIENYHNRN